MNSTGNEGLIVFLVPASSEPQALARSKVALSQVIHAAKRPVETFKEILLFEEGNRHLLTDKWGEFPSAVSAESELGAELIDDAISTTEQAFRENFEEVTESIEQYTEDEILENEDLVRNQLLSVGAFVGASVRVYAGKGRPLRSRPQLEEYAQKHDNLWVVPAAARW